MRFFYPMLLLAATVMCHGAHHSAKKSALSNDSSLFHNDGVLNLEFLEHELDKCAIVKELTHSIQHEFEHEPKSIIESVFEKLFPFSPAWNSVLATIYISGPPNLILTFIPASIEPSKLSMLVSFAVGGLLGDVFLHLLPQTFLGEPVDVKAHFVYVDESRNVVLGLFIFIGFAFFFSIDKALRILNHGEDSEHGHGHSHSHSHSKTHSHAEEHDEAFSSGVDAPSGVTKRKANKEDSEEQEKETAPVANEVNASVKAAAWLNLISDFTHNITDGLAITSAFYISRSVGSTTALAVFLHEVPHEIGDFAVLIQGGFTKWQAMNSQFVTAAGAFLGCFIGIFIQNLALKANMELSSSMGSGGLFGTTVTIGDLTLPFTAGGFLYIATVGVIPEVLELQEKTTRFAEVKKAFGQMFFILLGIGLMFMVSWFE